MPSIFISCQDCGTEYETTRKNTRYCRPCRILRNLTYYGPRTVKCWTCEEAFSPYEAKQVFCGQHGHKPDSAPIADCGLCKQRGPVLHEDIHVCFNCSTDTKQRPRFIRALTAKQERRVAAAA